MPTSYSPPRRTSSIAPSVGTPLLSSEGNDNSQTGNYRRFFLLLTTLAILVLYAVNYKSQNQVYRTPTTLDIAKRGSTSSSISDTVVFAIIGDWGRQGHHGQQETANALAIAIPEETSCIISVGDNFYSNGVSSVLDTQFQSSFENIYSQPRIRSIPWYLALGNHDHRGSFRAQILYSHVSPRWNMPARYYSQWLSSHLLAIFVDTTPFSDTKEGQVARTNPAIAPERQLAWLGALLASTPTHTRFLIVGHHNMYSASVEDHQGDLSVRDALEPVLLPFSSRIVAYVAGHEHEMMHMKPYASGIASTFDHFVSGAGSKLRPIVPAPEERADYWRTCCGVLVSSTNTSIPRTVWSKSENGFFIFRIEKNTFTAIAINATADSIYRYTKTLDPLPFEG